MSATRIKEYQPVTSVNGFSDQTANELHENNVDEDNDGDESGKRCSIIPMRVVLTILGFFGLINFYTMRANLSVAIVAMVGKRHTNRTNSTLMTCPELITLKNVTELEETERMVGEFDWDSEIQGQVLGSFFYGYIITQIPGGILAEKYGGKWIVGLGIFITAIFTLLTPLAARWSVIALIGVRVIEGLASGVVSPAIQVLISRWAPKNERTRISTSMIMGIMVGTVISGPITGVLCQNTSFGGWPMAFYFFGCLSCVWFLFWSVLVFDTPETHPYISKRELNYIKKSIDKVSNSGVKIPWKSIWTSFPVWALILSHFAQNWGFYILLIMTPTYLSNILHFDLKSNGLISGLPWLMMVLFSSIASMIADKLRASGSLNITNIRKLMTSIAFFSPGLCVLLITFLGCNPTMIVALLSLSFGLNGFIFSGVIVNHIDMSPQFAGTLFGITNTVATFPGFLVPTSIGAILKTGQTLQNWGIVFWTTSAIYFISGIIFNIFASAELQPWNNANRNSLKNPAKTDISLKRTACESIIYKNHDLQINEQTYVSRLAEDRPLMMVHA